MIAARCSSRCLGSPGSLSTHEGTWGSSPPAGPPRFPPGASPALVPDGPLPELRRGAPEARVREGVKVAFVSLAVRLVS